MFQATNQLLIGFTTILTLLCWLKYGQVRFFAGCFFYLNIRRGAPNTPGTIAW